MKKTYIIPVVHTFNVNVRSKMLQSSNVGINNTPQSSFDTKGSNMGDDQTPWYKH